MTARRLAVPLLTAGRRLLADRGAVIGDLGFYLIVTVVLSALWRAAAGPGGEIVGYSAGALTWYAATSEAAICAISIRLIAEVGDDISSGDVVTEMLRPLPVIAVRLSVQAGRSLVRLSILVVAGAGLCWITVGPPPSGTAALLALPSLVLAVAANLVLQHTVAAVAFWLRDTRAPWFVYQKLVFVLGGMLLPLQVLPDALQPVALALPFMTMAYAPARLASGSVEPWLLLVQLAWLVVLVPVVVATFRLGENRVQVVGG